MDKIFLKQSRLLLRILPMIKEYSHFALKGGTALNFFIQDLPRLSVDIDLTYIPINSRQTALREITSSMVSLKKKIEKQYKSAHIVIKRTRDGFIKGLLVNVDAVSIKIEPNHVLRGTVFDIETKSLTSSAEELFEVELDFPILSIPDLYGGKICAALDRQHPRDIFDILLMQETIGYTELIKQALLVYIISHPRPISELLNPNLLDIKEVYGKEFQNMTIRNVTVEDLELVRKQLIKRVNSSLTEQDKLFLLSVKRGKPSWDLHPLHRIQDLPAVQWKLKNILKMNTDKNKEALDKLDAVLFEGNS